MPITLNNVSFNRSTASNGAVLSLGGAISTEIASQVATQPAVVTGVYISKAFGNTPGLGTLTYNPVPQELGWKPPGSIDTYSVAGITADGSFTLSGPNGAIVVTITFASLPATYKIESIEVASPIGTVFGQVTATMSLVGDVQYRCVYFKNAHPSLTANDVRLYIHSPPALPQLLAIGVDPAGPGNGVSTGVAQVLANEHDVPAGVTFSSPILAASGISLGTLAPGQSIAFWQRRTVPAMAYGPLAIINATLGVALVG